MIMLCALALPQHARALDLPYTTNIHLSWTPASGDVSGYLVFGQINGKDRQLIGISGETRINLTDPGFVVGDQVVVEVQAFDEALQRGPLSPASETLRFVSTPVWSSVPDQQLQIGDRISLALHASIASGAPLVLSSVNLPAFATIDDNGDGTGSLHLAPDPGDAGFYEIDLLATNEGPPAQTTSLTIYVHVSGASDVPMLDPVADTAMQEGQRVDLAIRANEPIVASSPDLPHFATITHAAGAATLSLQPGFDDAGVYSVQIDAARASDPSKVSSATFTVAVSNYNRPPILTAPTSVEVLQGESFRVDVSAVDPDGDAFTILLLVGGRVVAVRPISFVETASLLVPAEETFAGDFTAQIVVVDSVSVVSRDTALLSVHVVPPPQDQVTPSLVAIPNSNGIEGRPLGFSVATTNSILAPFSIVAFGVPPFAQFVDHGNGQASLTGFPDWGDRGVFDVTVVARNALDAGLVDSEQVRLTIAPARVLTSHATRGDLLMVDPVTGAALPVAGTTHAIDLAIASDGTTYALRQLGHGVPPAVLEVDPFSRTSDVVSAGGLLSATNYGPTGLTVAQDGTIYVSTIDRIGSSWDPSIVAIDPATGSQHHVTSSSPLFEPLAIAAHADGRLFVCDTGDRSIIEVDPDTGATRAVASIDAATAIAAHPSGRFVVANGFGPPGTGSLLWFDPATSQLDPLASGGQLGYSTDVAVRPDGTIVVVDRSGEGLVTVDPASGAQRSWSVPGDGHTGVAVLP